MLLPYQPNEGGAEAAFTGEASSLMDENGISQRDRVGSRPYFRGHAMRSTFRQRLLASTLIIGASAFAAPAYAQDDQSETPVQSQTEADAAGSGEGIVITGSRIPRRDLTSSSPLTVVQDEEFTLSGAVNVEQVINTLPQVVPGATAFSNNPGGGVATLNLRGLGSQRNLVLVNGRRYIFYDANQVTDLNTIPQFLIESIDVVTGGASAVYGSDALAGVTNFRLRGDLDGLMAGGQYSITGEGDGRRYNAYMALGTQFADGRGHLAVYGEYYNRGDVFQGARDFSRFALADGDTSLIPGGSAGVPQGRFVAPGTITVGAPGSIGGANPSCGGTGNPPRNAGCFDIGAGTAFPGGGAFFGTPGVARPYNGATDAFNYAPDNYLMVPQERWTIGGYGEYEVSEGITAYGEVVFINNRVENELAATPITQNVNFNLNAACANVNAATCTQLRTIAANQQAAIAAAAAGGVANPFPGFTAGAGTFGALQPTEVRLQLNTRVSQISNRNVADDRNAFRTLIGVRGDLTESLTYDAYYSYARTRNASIQAGNVSRSNLTRLAADGTCNFFGANQLSADCIDGISILAQNTDISQLQVAQASLAGSLFQTPWATDSIGFAAGVEWRSMGGQFIPDTALASGDVAGFNAGDPTEGKYDVKEVFGELRLPLVQDNFIHRLELSAAARYSDYSLENVGGVWAYAAGAEFAPVSDITFRAQYQRAVRAPNVQELFGGQSVGFPAATDPCALASAATNATVRALCVATGVPSSNVGQSFLQPNPQIEGTFGGNPLLQEEVSDTYTAGVVLRPRFIPRLNIAVDWYDITVDNAIAAAGGGVGGVLNLCYNVIQDATSPLCQAITRDQQGSISGGGQFIVQANNANLAQLSTEGVDFQIDYSLPLAFGLAGADESKLSFYFLGNYTRSNNFVPTVGVDEVIECGGRFGNQCGNPTPKWKFASRVSWLDGPVTSTVRWRYVGKTRDDDDDTDYIVENLKSYNLFDLAFSFNVGDHLTLNTGVNNIFNKKPQLIGDNQEQANTYPSVYDVLGRDFFVSASLRF
ncbi:TonB-dependent receptor [Sphingomonas sp. LY54]|uniref:TonB-dependent receptor domain-containing protein n=1 Tax=Sphingomonas sp. LY54 TaxID=3095343 RepID=UPI002D76E6B2|nr:TonB-dependent receptor [Sphingomonas sp. LY54]WRP27655.1 TonB-dependent receptor [Sphingomonas sp. LY54]